MKDSIRLENIARELNVSRKTVQRLVSRGEIPAISVIGQGGLKYVVPIQSYLEWKLNYKKKKEEDKYLSDFGFLKEQQIKWLDWCRSGALVGKPMSGETVIKNNYALNAYWKRLPRRYQRTPLISVECLRAVLSSIDPKMFATKENIYKGVISFTKYLVKNSYCKSELFEKLKELKPKRLYPAKKLHCTEEQFGRLITEAKIRKNGQSEYDMILNKTLVATLGYAGLRGSELCNLRLQDVDLSAGKMFVHLGKGKKNRYVGICKNLKDSLEGYLKVRPKADIENFFITRFRGSDKAIAYNRHTLNRKIQRLAKRVEIKVSPHGLRRTFATVAANAGKPINIISLALGHADLKTTQGYLCTSGEEVIREMQGW